jgi:predicted secreted protein
MNRAARDAILRGVGGATETHDAFRLRERHEDGLSAIDVFALIEELQIPLQFLALDALLGTCIRISNTEVGILVTTQRDLHMQRFTAAHELGHFVLEHSENSLDREVRMPGDTQGRDPREIEADAFAAEFLMPKWLVRSMADRRGWWAAEALRQPSVVYQLSLRLAASYEATCWGLASHDFIERADAEALIGNGKRLKDVKRTALQGVPLDDSWADVWQLGATDDGARIEAGPNDLFVIDLEERAAAGFRWDFRQAADAGFALLADESTFDEAVVGGPSRRRVVLRAPAPGSYELRLPLSRPFGKAASTGSFRVAVSTVGTRKSADLLAGGAAPPTMH